MIEPEDQTKCKNCGRIVGRDETTKYGCIICEEEETELDFKEEHCKHCDHNSNCEDTGQLLNCMKHNI